MLFCRSLTCLTYIKHPFLGGEIVTEERKNEQPVNEETVEAIFAEEDVQVEQVNEEEAVAPMDELQTATAKIEELEAKIEEMDNKYLRLQADFDNSRRRAKLDMEAALKYRAQSLAGDLIQSLDNFERAMKVESDHEETKSMLAGMDMIYKGIVEALKKEGIEAIESVGKEFDPHMHQAVMQVQDDNVDSNIIVEEFQKGYKLKDRVIRPSMVKVSE